MPAAADGYRALAAEMHARALQEKDPSTQAEYETMAMAYLRLADQAHKNAMTDIVYETPKETN
jgi:ABC-type Zn uptake system ZnuABC Zn-binding protein ZnuA